MINSYDVSALAYPICQFIVDYLQLLLSLCHQFAFAKCVITGRVHLMCGGYGPTGHVLNHEYVVTNVLNRIITVLFYKTLSTTYVA